jgi:CheY-like chemotaxis protein
LKRVSPLELERRSNTPSVAEERELILYVEDDDENWDVAQLRLGASYTMLRAATSEQACELLREHGARIGLIFMDIELRGSELNGTELTEIFRGKSLARALPAYAYDLPVVTRPIIFVTAHGARYSDVELMLFGADLVIPKPVNFMSLSLALGSLPLARGRKR